MNSSFWQNLAKPIIGLSPMDGVTDQPFRHIQKKYGNPDLVYTEFTNVEGVCHGASRLLEDFLFDQTQRPIVAQVYGTTPDFFRQTAIVLCELGFDGIDINMGCPAKNVAHAGAGAALINNPQLAQKIITETKAGVQDWLNGKSAQDCSDIVPKIWQEVEARHQQLPVEYQQRRNIPVTVKTRIGYDQKVAADWAKILLEVEPAVIAFHGRTLKQQYSGQADWDEIARAAEVIHQSSDILVFGNGDVKNLEQAQQKTNQYGVDGVLIGRASFGNPFVFKPAADPAQQTNRFQIALEHARLFEKTYGDHPKFNFLPMRKHLGWYVKEVPFARQIRVELFQTNNANEVETILEKYQLLD